MGMIICFAKLFVILKYNSSEVPLSSKLPNILCLKKTELTLLNNKHVIQGEGWPHTHRSWARRNIPGFLDLKSNMYRLYFLLGHEDTGGFF